VPGPSPGVRALQSTGRRLEPLHGLAQARVCRCLRLEPTLNQAGEPQDGSFRPMVFVAHTRALPRFGSDLTWPCARGRQALASRLVDAPDSSDLAPEDLPTARTPPLGSFPELLARTADAGFHARPAVRTSVPVPGLLGRAHSNKVAMLAELEDAGSPRGLLVLDLAPEALSFRWGWGKTGSGTCAC
jgi:hypothetical protein